MSNEDPARGTVHPDLVGVRRARLVTAMRSADEQGGEHRVFGPMVTYVSQHGLPQSPAQVCALRMQLATDLGDVSLLAPGGPVSPALVSLSQAVLEKRTDGPGPDALRESRLNALACQGAVHAYDTSSHYAGLAARAAERVAGPESLAQKLSRAAPAEPSGEPVRTEQHVPG